MLSRSRRLNPVFIEYLSRYFAGITILKEKIKKISVSPEFDETFGRKAIRFYITIELSEKSVLSDKERIAVRTYFSDQESASGHAFVSFVYQDGGFFIEEIESFMLHYALAEELFSEFVKKVIPKTCNLEIRSLSEEPFFNYISELLAQKNSRVEKDFSALYGQLFSGREFEFDHTHHETIVDRANRYPEIAKEFQISDEELFKAGCGDCSHLRRYVLEQHIPFKLKGSTFVVDSILIDMRVLKEKIPGYKPNDNALIRLNPQRILKIIAAREKGETFYDETLREYVERYQLKIGNIIYVERDGAGRYCETLGIITAVDLDIFNNVFITYRLLKNDLSLGDKYARNGLTGMIYILRQSAFNAEMQSGRLTGKLALIQFMGVGNKHEHKS